MLKIISRLCAIVAVGFSSVSWGFDLVMDAWSSTLPVTEIEVVGKRPVRRVNTWPAVWISSGNYQVGGGSQQLSQPTARVNICADNAYKDICDIAVEKYCSTNRDAQQTANFINEACNDRISSLFFPNGVSNFDERMLFHSFVMECQIRVTDNLSKFIATNTNCR
jgi:hypothetical protein